MINKKGVEILLKQKIAFVLTALLYIAVTFVYIQYVKTVEASIETDKMERDGIEKIQYLLNLKMHLQRERGILMHTTEHQSKLQNIYSTHSQIEALFKAFPMKKIELDYDALFATKASLTPLEIFNSYTTLINECTKQIYVLVDQNRLIYESDSDVYNFLVLYAQDLPSIAEKMAKIRGYASKIFAHSNSTAMEYDRGTMDTYLNNLNDSKEIADLKFNRISQGVLNEENINGHTIDTINQFNYYIRQNLSARTDTRDHIDFFVHATTYIDTLYDIQESIHKTINVKIRQRQSIKETNIASYTTVYVLFNIIFFVMTTFIYRKMKQLFYSEIVAYQLNTTETKLIEFNDTHQHDDLKGLCKSVLDHLCDNHDVLNAAIYLVDRDNHRLSLAETWGINHKNLLHHLEFGEGVIGEVGLGKKMKLLEFNPQNNAYLAKAEISRSYGITAPLTYFEEMIGVIDLRTLNTKFDTSLFVRKLGIVSKYLYRSIQVSQNKAFIELFDKEIIVSKTDRFGQITYVSDAFVKISGYSKEELLGRSHNIIRHPDMPKTLYENLWTNIQAGKSWHGEIKNLRKDGTYYWVEAHITPNVDLYGEVIGFTAIREHITDKKKIEELSIKDPMTNLYNRRGLVLKQKELETQQTNSLYALLVDIDNFKLYNDHYGHEQGDRILIAVADQINALAVREKGYAFRLGGEEFMLLYPAVSRDEAVRVGEALVANVYNMKQPHEYNAQYGFVTVSAGLSELQEDDFESAYKNADEFLYKAKAQGRNRLCS